MDARALATTRVLDVDGTPVRLADQWKTRTAVVVWLRHFGCVYCMEAAREMTAILPDIEKARGHLVLVGNGGPRHALAFRDRHAPGVTVLTDPELGSYRAIGARRGIVSTLGPQTWGFALRALRRGARQSAVKGHPFQQGGVMVITPDNRIIYSHLSTSAGDHPPAAEVLEAVRQAGADASVDVGSPRHRAAVAKG